jgi:hypothetical protein
MPEYGSVCPVTHSRIGLQFNRARMQLDALDEKSIKHLVLHGQLCSKKLVQMLSILDEIHTLQ